MSSASSPLGVITSSLTRSTAGPAGGILASTLAKTKARPSVLLLEAGAKDENCTGYMTDRYSLAFTAPNLNWGYSTVAQKHLDSRVVDYSRGKVRNIRHSLVSPTLTSL